MNACLWKKPCQMEEPSLHSMVKLRLPFIPIPIPVFTYYNSCLLEGLIPLEDIDPEPDAVMDVLSVEPAMVVLG